MTYIAFVLLDLVYCQATNQDNQYTLPIKLNLGKYKNLSI